jgi:hypothetical protein
MNGIRLVSLAMLVVVHTAQAQSRSRKLPNNVNHPAINNYAPFISLDGNSMIYLADLGEDHALTMAFTTRQGVNWKDPMVLPRPVNHQLNFQKGYALSPDGKTIYVSNQRSNGMGGFDLYYSRLEGTRWEDPVNMLLPANSKGHEGCPSISLDGALFFYMRCDQMDLTSADGCRLMMMKKKPNGQWDNPFELPDYINTGNSQTPRIMADGEMLIFSSNKIQGGHGGFDLYYSRFVQGTWSQPQPLDFANTAGDDQYVSVTSAGMYLLRESPGQHSSELVEYLFPPEVRPKGTLRVEGKISGPPDLSSAYVTVFSHDPDSPDIHRDRDPGTPTTTQVEKDGTFKIYLNYGGRYDLSVEPANDSYTFFSKKFDLRGENNAMVEQVEATLLPCKPGDVIVLAGLEFEPLGSRLTSASREEIRRVARMIRGNPSRSFGIEVTLIGFLQDSVRLSNELTEIAYDSVKIPITYNIDSVTTATRDSVVVHPRYHNDRTLAQAKAIGASLLQEGIESNRMACSGKALPEALPERRRTTVQLIVH